MTKKIYIVRVLYNVIINKSSELHVLRVIENVCFGYTFVFFLWLNMKIEMCKKGGGVGER